MRTGALESNRPSFAVSSPVNDRLGQVFASVFGIEPTALTDADSPATIAAWDSLSHVSLILALEAEFGVAFDAGDLATLTSVADIRRRLAELDVAA